MTYIDIR